MMKIYKSYSFKNKDPIVDRLRTIIQDEGVSYQQVHEASDVAVSTLYNWFEGPTRRPTYACVAAVINALGYEHTIAKRKGARIIPLPSIKKRG